MKKLFAALASFVAKQWQANAWRLIALSLAAVLALVLLVGCGGASERNTGLEQGRAPKGPVSYAEGQRLAAQWAAAIPYGTYGSVSNTGSMEPLIDSAVIPVYAPADGSNLAVGQIVVYQAASGRQIIHQVADINATHFIPDGVANARYDGWVPRSRINRVVVGLIYTAGKQ